MGGSSGGSSTTYVKAKQPTTVAPIAPVRTAAGAQPENAEQAQFSSGAKITEAEAIASGKGSSRLVIPLEQEKDNVQSGGFTQAPTASSIVGGKV